MNSATSRQGRLFHGWWIVAGSFMIMATCYTIFVNCIPLFQSHMVRDLGATVAQFNTGVSLCTVVAIFASLAFGALVERVPARLLGGFTVLTSSVVLALFSFVQQMWQFYLLCVVAGMVVVAGTRLLASVLTTNWFNARRGLAVAIALSGSGVGGVILSPVTSRVIDTAGWRTAFLVLAVVCLVAAMPIALLAFTARPSDRGLQPYGAGQSEARRIDPSPDPSVTVAVGWPVLRSSGGFWVLVFGFVMMGIVNGAIITNSVSNMTTMTLDGLDIPVGGHSTIWAGYVWSGYLGVVIVAKIALGAIYDRWGLHAGTLLGTLACVIASVALCFPASVAGPVIAAVAFGFGTCMGTVTPPVMAAKAYGKKDIGMITGIVTAFELFGAAIGAVVSGMFFDRFHSFVPAWTMTLIASLLMGLTLWLAVPAARRIVQRRIEAGAPQIDAEGREIVAAA